MEFKKFMTMAMAAVAIVMGVSSCSSDDDDDKDVAVAAEVAGQYTGQEEISVMGEVSSDDTKTYQIVKATDNTVDLTVPESGEMGHMTIPALTIKSSPLTKNGKTISGGLPTYAGTVTNAQGAEKAFTINGLTILVNEKTAVVAFSLKYGNMPMSMETTFTGTKQ